MTRRRFIQKKEGGFIEVPQDYVPPQRKTPYIIGDYQPYRCAGLGEVVKSRKHRRQLMKEKGLIEVGNDSSAIMNINDGRYDDFKYEEPDKALLDQVREGL